MSFSLSFFLSPSLLHLSSLPFFFLPFLSSAKVEKTSRLKKEIKMECVSISEENICKGRNYLVQHGGSEDEVGRQDEVDIEVSLSSISLSHLLSSISSLLFCTTQHLD